MALLFWMFSYNYPDMSVAYEHQDLLHYQAFAGSITFFDYILTGIVSVTVWHLGSPNYILVSSACVPCLCPVTFVSYYCIYLLVYALLYLTFCYIFLPAKYLHSILLQLPFGQTLQLILVLYCSSCTSQLPYLPSLWVQFVLAFSKVLSVYFQLIQSFF